MDGSSCTPAVVGTSGTRPKRGTVRFGVVCAKNAFRVRQVDVCESQKIDKIRDFTAKFDHICGKHTMTRKGFAIASDAPPKIRCCLLP